jgi:hypothetical protein
VIDHCSAQEAISWKKCCINHYSVNSNRVNCSLNSDLIKNLNGIIVKKTVPLTIP